MVLSDIREPLWRACWEPHVMRVHRRIAAALCDRDVFGYQDDTEHYRCKPDTLLYDLAFSKHRAVISMSLIFRGFSLVAQLEFCVNPNVADCESNVSESHFSHPHSIGENRLEALHVTLFYRQRARCRCPGSAISRRRMLWRTCRGPDRRTIYI